MNRVLLKQTSMPVRCSLSQLDLPHDVPRLLCVLWKEVILDLPKALKNVIKPRNLNSPSVFTATILSFQLSTQSLNRAGLLELQGMHKPFAAGLRVWNPDQPSPCLSLPGRADLCAGFIWEVLVCCCFILAHFYVQGWKCSFLPGIAEFFFNGFRTSALCFVYIFS